MKINNLNVVWEKALKIIEPKVIPVSYNTWFLPLVPLDSDEDSLYFEVDEPFKRDMIIKKFRGLLEGTIKEVTGRDYNIIIKAPNDNIKDLKKKAKAAPETGSNLNPRYTFDSFVVGASNRMAHAASLAVAESPAMAYNPLFLYGGVGLGKTHLMHSIAHFILSQNPDTKIVYASCEKFTNELINSIRNNQNESFRNKYRNVDVLLIDDIQFIADKELTQEEFFHTFNTLHEANKQIIISSDRPPRDIKTLEERLRSRFEWGLVADIQPPDYETRIAILRKKAETETVVIPNEVFAFMAKSIVSNIRELEGALTRLTAYSTLTNCEITIKLAEETLMEIFNQKAKREITPAYIQEVVCHHFNISIEDMRSKKRTQALAYPRQIAMYLSRKLTTLSLPQIGNHFGGRDHTTIIYGCDKIAEDIEKSAQFDSLVSDLEKMVLGGD